MTRMLATAIAIASFSPLSASAAGQDGLHTTTVRTETFARPPYSGATYYIYERDGRTICTKVAVCNKIDQSDTQYVPDAFHDPQDADNQKPSATSPAMPIAAASLARHVCLTRFGLAGQPLRTPPSGLTGRDVSH